MLHSAANLLAYSKFVLLVFSAVNENVALKGSLTTFCCANELNRSSYCPYILQ